MSKETLLAGVRKPSNVSCKLEGSAKNVLRSMPVKWGGDSKASSSSRSESA